MNTSSLQQPPSGDTSSLRQIPQENNQCSKTLSDEAIARLRETYRRKKSRHSPFMRAVVAANAELGIKIALRGDINEWNRAIENLDRACPDWRGFTIERSKRPVRAVTIQVVYPLGAA